MYMSNLGSQGQYTGLWMVRLGSMQTTMKNIDQSAAAMSAIRIWSKRCAALPQNLCERAVQFPDFAARPSEGSQCESMPNKGQTCLRHEEGPADGVASRSNSDALELGHAGRESDNDGLSRGYKR